MGFEQIFHLHFRSGIDEAIERKQIMDTDGRSGLIIVLAAALIKAFFTVCETAVTEIGDKKLKNSEKTIGGTVLLKLLEKPSRLVTTFSVTRMLTAAVISYGAAFSFIAPLGKILAGFESIGAGLANVLATVIVLLCTVLVLTVLCDGLPKKIASGGSRRLACFCAPFVKYLVIILTPLTALSSLLIRLLAKIFVPGDGGEKDVVTEEEILMMVDAGSETGVVEQSQREMINNVFDFDDRLVSEIMTHRTDVTAVRNTAKISEIVNAAIESGFSRIPVYEDSIDHIVGMICVKDLLCFVGSEAAESAEASSFVRDIIYLPESVPCGEAFKRLTENKMQIAAVIDEYGGTAGIVTMEDIVETIVGNIQDEYDDEEEDIVKISEGTYTIAGTADPEEVFEALGIPLPERSEEDGGEDRPFDDLDDFDTMSGFIVELLGRIPEENESPSVEYENWAFTVLVTEDKCISKIKAAYMSTNEKNEEKGEHSK